MVAPDYAADLLVPIFERGRRKERDIGSSTMNSVHVSPNYYNLYYYYHYQKNIYQLRIVLLVP